MSSLTRNKRLWIMVVALVMLSTVYFLFPKPGDAPSAANVTSTTTAPTTSTTVDACSGLTGSYRVDCVVEAALNRRDMRVCDRLDDSDYSMCVEEYAYAEKDLSICETLDGNAMISCVMRGVVELGESGKVDPEDCYIIPPDLRRDQCFFHAATINENDGLCDSIADDDMRLYCITAVTGQDLCTIMKDEFHRMLCRDCVENGDCFIIAREYGGRLRWW